MGSNVICPTCGAEAQAGAFCSMCGSRLGVPANPARDGAEYGSQQTRRVFEWQTASVVGAAVLVGLAAVLVVLGAWELALILLVGLVGAGIILATRPRSRRSTRTHAHPLVNRFFLNLRDYGRYATYSLGSWTRAGRDVFLLRQQLRALESERHRRVYALGEEAMTGDQAQLEAAREQVSEIDAQRAAVISQINEIISGTRDHLGEERLTVQPTELVRDADDEGASQLPR